MKASGRFGVRRLIGLGVASLGLASSLLALTSVSGSADSGRVPPDRQTYWSAAGAADPYTANSNGSGPDQLNMHVGANGSQITDLGLVHLELDSLPPGATVNSLSIVLKLGADNVNNTMAKINACPLKAALPSAFNGDSSPEPAFDCAGAKAAGKQSPDGTTWTFDLGALAAWWHDHGNTGMALVPDTSGVGPGLATDNWAVGYDVSLTEPSASYSVPPASNPTPQPTAQPAPYVPPQALPIPVQQTVPDTSSQTPVAVAASPSPATQPRKQMISVSVPIPAAPGGFQPWLLVLVASVAAAAGLLIQPVSTALSHGGGVLAGGAIQLRSHPRLFAVVAILCIWTLAFSVYSNTVGRLAPASHFVIAQVPAPADGSTIPNVQPSTVPSAGPGGVVNPGPATGSSGGSTAQTAAQTEFQGPGTTKFIDGTEVFFPANGGVPVARLYSGADDTVGLTDNSIELCNHAALTFGPAFHISAADLQVFWQAVNDAGGIHGRQVHVDFKDDAYQPGNAVQAAQQCKDINTFILLGGIGFDQIPAVRQWAETNHELYLHHIATTRGTAGLKYSFSGLPSIEQDGTMFAQLYLNKFRGKKIGVIYRQSPNWQPGVDAFNATLAAAGVTADEYPVMNNQGDYHQELVQMQNVNHDDVVWIWENALAATEIIQQAQGQAYKPNFLVFPFNLTLQTLSQGNGYSGPPMYGVADWPAYDFNQYGGPYAAYGDQVREFEQQYQKYDRTAYDNMNPKTSGGGFGGDLLFLAWAEFKGLADLLDACGRDCTRNKIAGIMLSGYHKTVPPNCDADYGLSDHHHAGYLHDVFTTYTGGNGTLAWRPIDGGHCISRI